jgi:hypothetical protein
MSDGNRITVTKNWLTGIFADFYGHGTPWEVKADGYTIATFLAHPDAVAYAHSMARRLKPRQGEA